MYLTRKLKLAFLFLVFAFNAKAVEFEEGKHYIKIPADLVAEAGLDKLLTSTDKIQVVEFFSYACSGCNQLEEQFDAWSHANSDKYNVVKVPVVFKPGWNSLAKAYYAAKNANMLDKTHKLLFSAIHQKHKRLAKDEKLISYLKEEISDVESFVKSYNSDKVIEQLNQAKKIAKVMHVGFIPETIVKTGDEFFMVTASLPKGSSSIDVVEYITSKDSK